MARTEYQRQLDELRGAVLLLSEAVCRRFHTALRAYDAGDLDAATEVITGDHEINQRYLELESQCIELLALQQPVAGDLRFIAASFKITTDLERVGDLATNIGEYTRVEGTPPYTDIDIVALGEDAIEMVDDATAAYASDDVAATYELAKRDDEIDARCVAASEFVVRDAIGRTGEKEPVLEDVSRALLTIRDIERTADHAVNIAARTLYMLENDDALIY